MTDQDLIRRCVERAEGWEIFTDYEGTYWIDSPWEETPFIEPDQCALDALAAQLVRQVDAIEGGAMWVIVDPQATSIRDQGVIEIMTSVGNDRTLNTLRAIDEFYRGQNDD